ncbi:MAG: trigger factor [Fusobacterium sp.]|nr:trigger factor [Fusobacterium sp.]
MKHEVKKLERSAVEVKIFLDKDELTPILDKVVKHVAEKVEIPGFRKGKAPKETIISHNKEHIQEDIANEVITIISHNKEHIQEDIANEVISTKFGEIVEAEKLQPISYVAIKSMDLADTFEVVFDVDVYPEFEVAEYKGLSVEKGTFEISDEKVNEEIETLLNREAKLEEVTDEAYKLEMGDTVDLAFEGFMDGVPFPGGKADSHELKLGSKTFIDNFEEQLVGYVKGQEGEITVNFPEEYHAKELAGKPAVFKVKINAIKKLSKPELNDEFAKSLSYESVEDLKAKKAEEITKRENDKIENDYVAKLVEEVAKNTTVEIPRSMVKAEIEARMREMEYQLSSQGFKIDDYFKMMGADREAFMAQIAPSAEAKVKTDLVLDKIALKENIEVSEEEINEKMKEISKMYGMELEAMEAELKKNNNLENFKTSVKFDARMKKTIDLIVKEAK